MDIREKIRDYVMNESLTDKDSIKDDTLLFDSGVFDSMGLLFLIEFINDTYQLEVGDEDLNPKNFESINAISEYISEKVAVK